MEPEQNLAGTPNPLNPNPEAEALDANPSEQMTETVEEPANEPTEEPATEPVIEPAPEPVTPPRPANPNRPVDPMIPVQQPHAGPVVEPTPIAVKTPETHGMTDDNFQSMGVVTDMNGVPEDPLNRPMQKAVEQLPPKPKKKKTGLIVGAVICLFLAIGCGVAAALVLMNHKKEDVVAMAVGRLLSGEAPANMAVDGTINVEMDDASSEITSMQIALRSELVPKSMINSTEAKINVNLRSGQSFSLDVDEVYAANGDLYLKLDGLTNLLGGSENLATNCAGDPEMNCATEVVDCASDSEADCGVVSTEVPEQLASLFETVDGEWIRISTDDLAQLTDMTASEGTNCTANLINDLNGNSNSLIEIYNKSPFITSTTEGLEVQSEKNPIHGVLLDSDKLADFLNEAQSTTAIQNYLDCNTQEEEKEVSAAEIAESLSEMPEIYVEVDGDYNFTRLYTQIERNSGSVTVDLDFSYPTNVNIPEPTEYRDLTEMLQALMASMLEMSEEIDEGGELEVVIEE